MSNQSANTDLQEAIEKRLLSFIPIDSNSILEIGSERSDLEGRFRRRNPLARWTRSEHAQFFDFGKSYSVVVLRRSGYEPGQLVSILERLAKLLVLEGSVVIEFPNPFYWRSLFSMLGSKSSIRIPNLGSGTVVFSADGFAGVFFDAGLTLRKAKAFNIEIPSPLSEMVGAVGNLPEWSGRIDAKLIKSRLEQESLILIGSSRLSGHAPSEFQSKLGPKLVIAMLAMAPNFADVRTKLPLAAYASRPDVEVIYLDKQGHLPALPVDIPKVLVVQRQLPESEQSWSEVVARLHQKGWAVVAEWDDHPDLFAPSIRARFDSAPWASVILADAVQTSTVALLNKISEVTDRPVAVFENRILELPEKTERFKGDLIRVLISGLNRTSEFLSLFELVNELPTISNQVEFFVLQDEVVFKTIKTSRKKFVRQLSYEDYHKVLDECDVALMPLHDTVGNRCKSDLKWVECASHGIACIGSRVVYGETIRHHIDGLISDSISDFPKHLKLLIDTPAFISKYGSEARQRVREERLLSQVTEKRISWYLSVWRSVFRSAGLMNHE